MLRTRGLALLLLCLGSPAVAADEPAAQEEAPASARPPASGEAPSPPPVVPLEKLFELPSGFEPTASPRRAGASEGEWRERFRQAHGRLGRAQAALERSKQELAELAGSSEAWTLSPPVGGGATAGNNDAPLSYELRQRMKREKDEVEAARRDLVDLEVEANLAGVPEDWRTE